MNSDRNKYLCRAAVLLAGILLSPNAAAEEWPIPVRRVILDPARLPDEIRKHRELVRIERHLFESALKEASARLRAEMQPPRLMDARYEARLQGACLSGSAVWKIKNPHPVGAFYSIQPWKLALRPGLLVDEADPILAVTGRNIPAIWIPPDGMHTIRLNWSAKGDERADGLHFDLRMPQARVATMSLLVPDGHELSGTLPVDSDGQRRRITFGKSSQLQFRIGPARSNRAGRLSYTQHARFRVEMNKVTAEWNLGVSLQKGSRTELRMVWPEGWTSTAVTLDRRPVTVRYDDQNRRTLVVTVDPYFEERVVIKITGEQQGRTIGRLIRFPLLQLQSAAAREEKITVHATSDVDLDIIEMGDFAPDIIEDAAQAVAGTIRLRCSDPLPSMVRKTPAARIVKRRPRIAARQESWLRAGAAESEFLVKTIWDMNADRRVQPAFRIPENWEVTSVQLTPPALQRSWDVDPTTSSLQISTHPVPRDRASISTEVRLRRTTQGDEGSFPIPDLRPLRAIISAGEIKVSFDEAVVGQITDFQGFVEPPRILTSPLNGEAVIAQTCSYSGGSPKGAIQLRRSSEGLNAQCATIFEISENGLTGHYYVALSSIGAGSHLVPVWISGIPDGIRWNVESGPAIIERHVAGQEGLKLQVTGSDPILLHAAARFGAAPDISVPLLSVSGSTRQGGELIVCGPAGSPIRFFPPGFARISPSEWTTALAGGSIIAAFRYHQGQPTFPLRIGQESDLFAPPPRVEDSTLTIELTSSGHWHSRYQGSIHSSEATEVHLLPVAGVKVRTVRVNQSLIPMPTARDVSVRIPIGAGRTDFDVSFVHPDAQSRLFSWVPELNPTWAAPVVALPCKHRLQVPSSHALMEKDATSVVRFNEDSSIPVPGNSTEDLLVRDRDALLIVARRDVPFWAGSLAMISLWICLRRWEYSTRLAYIMVTSMVAGILCYLWISGSLSLILGLLIPPIVLLMWGRSSELRKPSSKSVRSLDSPSAVCLAGVVCVAGTIMAQPGVGRQNRGRPAIVYILPGSADGQADFALAPGALWSQVQRLRDERPGAVDYGIQRTEHKVRIDADIAHIESIIELDSFVNGPVRIELPIGSLRLKSALLDGAPISGSPLEPADGIALEIPEKGRHVLVLNLEGPVNRSNEIGEFRFPVVSGPVSALSVRAEGKLENLHQVTGPGGQWFQTGDDGCLLEVDLGPTNQVHLRWVEPSTVSPLFRVRENYLWDVRPSNATLLGQYYITPTRGAMRTFRIKLPPGLSVIDMQAKSREGRDSQRIRSWEIRQADHQRYLEIQFSHPTVSNIRLEIEFAFDLTVPFYALPALQTNSLVLGLTGGLIPLKSESAGSGALEWAVARRRSIFLPVPRAEATTRLPGLVGYRLEGMLQTAARTSPAMEAWMLEDLFLYGPLELARSKNVKELWRFPFDADPWIFLTVQPFRAKLSVDQFVTLQPELESVGIRADAKATVSTIPVYELSWRIPSELVVRELTGPNLSEWVRQGDEIRMRWNRPVIGPVEWTLTGRLSLSLESNPEDSFVVPEFRLLGAGRQSTIFSLLEHGQLSSWPVALSGLSIQSPVLVPVAPLTLVADGPDFFGMIRVEKPKISARAVARTKFRPKGLNPCEFQTTLRLEGEVDSSREIIVGMSGPAFSDVEMNAGAESIVRKRPTGPNSCNFHILPRIDRDAVMNIDVSGKLSSDAGKHIAPPDYSVAGLGDVDHKYVLLDDESEVTPTQDSAWMSADNARILIPPTTQENVAGSSVRILSQEIVTQGTEGSGHIHTASYWVSHGPGAVWNLTFSEDTAVWEVQSLTSPLVGVLQQGDRVAIRFPARSGIQKLRVIWLDRNAVRGRIVCLRQPRGDQAHDGPLLWRIPQALPTEADSLNELRAALNKARALMNANPNSDSERIVVLSDIDQALAHANRLLARDGVKTRASSFRTELEELKQLLTRAEPGRSVPESEPENREEGRAIFRDHSDGEDLQVTQENAGGTRSLWVWPVSAIVVLFGVGACFGVHRWKS